MVHKTWEGPGLMELIFWMGKQKEAIKYLYVVINVARKADKKMRKKIEEEGVPLVRDHVGLQERWHLSSGLGEWEEEGTFQRERKQGIKNWHGKEPRYAWSEGEGVVRLEE